MLIVVLALALPFASQETPERHVRATERSILALMILPALPSATQFPALRPITLVVTNVAEVPREIMSETRREVARLYSYIGLMLAWEEDSPSDIRTVSLSPEKMLLRITILKDDLRRQRGHRPLGAAPRSPREARVACVYYARVEQRARRGGLEPALVLGHAIAHEVFHLLLPAYEHATRGLMKAVWDRADLLQAEQGQLRFSDEQAALIRAALAP